MPPFWGPPPRRYYVPSTTGQFYTWASTTTTTTHVADAVTEADVRRIVREELADLLPVDVPDRPPEA